MWPVPARWSTKPDSVRLSSHDNGCERVIKHKTDVPQASISHVPQRFTVMGCCGVEGGGNATPHINSVSSFHFTSSSWKICVLREIPQLLTCVIYFHSSDLQVRQNCTCVQYLSESTRKYDPLQSSTAHFAKEHNAILKERNKYAATNWGSTCKD